MAVLDAPHVPSRSRDLAISATLAALIAGAWLGLHVGMIFLVDWSRWWALAPVGIAVQTWLSVGLFIIAHDTMHGSFAPGRPRVNHWVGQACVGLYAAFGYRRLMVNHHAHHRHAGTAQDPDFNPDGPRSFWPWYYRFFRTYFGWREFAILTAVLAAYAAILGWGSWRILAFWALPALFSSLQLFTFGTWRPHRHEDDPQAWPDRHQARSNDFPPWLSLLTCFHFGYHHEHHDRPSVPWWRLPQERALAREVRP